MSNEKSNIEDSDHAKPLNIGVSDDSKERLLEVTALASGGRGLARRDGVVWFVRDAFPGDRVWAVPERVRSSFIEAVPVRWEERAAERRDPPCPHQSRCGGCPWMGLEESSQLEWKRQLVLDALQRIGKIAAPEVEQVLRPSPPLGYRNRVEFSAGAAASGDPALGLWGREGLIDLPDCMLQGDGANAVLKAVRRFLAAHPAVRAKLASHGPFRLLIRSTVAGELLVGLWGAAQEFPAARELADYLIAAPERVDTIVALHAKPGRRGGVRCSTLHGRGTMTERVGEFEFRLPAQSFMQINPAGAEELIRRVCEFAAVVKGQRVIDLYGGFGAFGMHLALRKAGTVVVCDADRDAIQAGKSAAHHAGMKDVRFVHATVQAYLRTQEGKKAGVVIANPPRAGFGKGIAARILALQPVRVVLVSCDPPTLARDLRPFLDAGYKLTRVLPIDLFPQTHHIETVVQLSR